MAMDVPVRGVSPAECARRAIEDLRASFGADGGALMVMDPVTRLFTTGAVDRLPEESCHPFFAAELGDSPRTFRRMAEERAAASAVFVDRDRDDPLVRDVLSPHGFAAEARASIGDGCAVWGAVTLWRRSGRSAFRPDEVARLDREAGRLAPALRDAVVESLATTAAGDGPGPGQLGVLLVEHGRVTEVGPDAAEVLREFRHPASDEYRHLDHLRALAAADPRFSTVLRTPNGWIAAHGSPLGPDRVAVTLAAAGPERLLGARVVAAGLSAREVEVTRLLCRGLSDREIARSLGVSDHTAHDHVRAVRRKLGVRSRAEVSATIFADRYFASFLSSAALGHVEP